MKLRKIFLEIHINPGQETAPGFFCERISLELAKGVLKRCIFFLAPMAQQSATVHTVIANRQFEAAPKPAAKPAPAPAPQPQSLRVHFPKIIERFSILVLYE